MLIETNAPVFFENRGVASICSLVDGEPALFLKAIPYAAHSLDIFSHLAELAPQAYDLHVHAAFGNRIIPALDGFNDLVAGEHPTGTLGQKTENGDIPSRSGE